MNPTPPLAQLFMLSVFSLLAGCEDPTTRITPVEGKVLKTCDGQDMYELATQLP